MTKEQREFYSSERILFNHAIYLSPNDRFAFHTHDVVEVILFLSGDISYIVEGKQYKIKDNDIFIVAPSVLHRVKFDSSADYERFNLLIDESTLPDGLVEKLFDGKNYAVQNAAPEMEYIFRRLCYYCENFEPRAVDDLAVSLITELFYNMLYAEERSQRTAHVLTNRMVQNAIEYIDANITTLENLDEILRHLNVSKCHFHRIFRGELGITPMDYIREKRLSIARRLLHSGSKPADVYAECGFSSYTAFYRAYKANYGYSPSEESEKGYPKYVIRS